MAPLDIEAGKTPSDMEIRYFGLISDQLPETTGAKRFSSREVSQASLDERNCIFQKPSGHGSRFGKSYR